ncbi:hypothetical protein H9Y04_33170 [Streptomyces sp. TRM66268-LWL]|uniref:Uncharacterized protein n=1 Tax=Streptomyces polyasparticus TaxID=2767826 RepID=A0ABR7SR22_9ACTN|nr:hypothetical protein [Streptomyces polyasparticus]MBC9717392.1 hypothetical protein [Streptomyces polyasparticus]
MGTTLTFEFWETFVALLGFMMVVLFLLVLGAERIYDDLHPRNRMR